MLKAIQLRTKLFLLCGFFLAVIAVVGGTAYRSSLQTSEEYNTLVSVNLPKDVLIQGYFNKFLEIRMNLRNLGLPGIPLSEAQASERKVLDNIKSLQETREKYQALGFSAKQKPLYDDFLNAWTDFEAVGGRVLTHYRSGSPEEMQKMIEIFFTDCPRTAGKFTEAFHKLEEYHKGDASHSVSAAQDFADTGLEAIGVTVILGAIVGISLGFIFATGLSKSLNSISGKISTTASETSMSATGLASASSQLSSSSTQAAASLEETVASLEELSAMVQMNASNASKANELSQNSKESAEKGELEISKLIHSMADIKQGSRKIEEIISVIDDIAFQTNLLALNASVEAARAGEQGRGFAVVADAVRALAQRSASAAKDINTLIKENVEKTENGSVAAGDSGAALKEIMDSVKVVAELNAQISSSSQEQATGLEQISKAMNQLDQATQTNASSSESVASSSEQMAGNGHLLSDLSSALDALVNGSRAA